MPTVERLKEQMLHDLSKDFLCCTQMSSKGQTGMETQGMVSEACSTVED